MSWKPGRTCSICWSAIPWSARVAGLAGQAAAARRLPAPGEPGLVSPRLQLVDLQYSDVRLDKGLYNRLVARFDETSGDRAAGTRRGRQPADRHPRLLPGRMPRRFGADIAAASWDSVIFDLGGDSLVRIPTLERCAAPRPMSGACWTPSTVPSNWWTTDHLTDRRPGYSDHVRAGRYCGGRWLGRTNPVVLTTGPPMRAGGSDGSGTDQAWRRGGEDEDLRQRGRRAGASRETGCGD